jgi:UDP-GlcNAc:undecaprenyl-phosphate GlcNAc-1-phosphate transferase
MLPFPLASLVSLLVALIGSFCLVTSAERAGLLDFPDGLRKTHRQPTPTGGGIAIALAFYSGLAFLPSGLPRWFFAPAIGAILLLAMGAVDDRFRLAPLPKLLVQITATGVALVPFVSVLSPADTPPMNAALLCLMSLFVLMVTNGYNLIDGVDGLSASLAVLSAALLVVFSSLAPPPGFPGIEFLSVLVAFSLLGFLVFNLPPARLFLGDSGSHFAGFLVACLWLPYAAASHLGAVAAVSANIFPVADVVASVWRRARSGVPIFRPDRDHLHFRALRKVGSPSTVVFLFMFITIMFFGFFTLLKAVIGE